MRLFTGDQNVYKKTLFIFRDVDHHRGRRLRGGLREDQDDELRCRLKPVDAQAGVGLVGERSTTTRSSRKSSSRHLLSSSKNSFCYFLN